MFNKPQKSFLGYLGLLEVINLINLIVNFKILFYKFISVPLSGQFIVFCLIISSNN